METSNEAVAPIFTRSPYVVYASEIDVEYCGGNYNKGYVVQNMETDMIEYQTPSLSEAIQFAHHSAACLGFLVTDPPVVSTGILET